MYTSTASSMGLINNTINGYTFLSFIGSGSFGSVYKVEKDNNFYAVKVFRESYVYEEYLKNGENNRIRREIDIMKSVDHPFLVKYIDDFKHTYLNNSSYFLVMEYVQGQTLEVIIKSKLLRTENEIIELFSRILEGVRGLHNIINNGISNGIIHRDLKPENIIVSRDSVKILDYGISKVIDYTSLTSTGKFIGSPAYASPEQIRDSKNIDKRSDLYTLGVILYEMLTNQLPYSYNGLPDLINKILFESPIPPRKWNPNLSNYLENIILKLLGKKEYQRLSKSNRARNICGHGRRK
ncbi:serine/threonine protein kinase [bacterium]|nr:MAG: serine/threonine protein kinase [bacterium]